MRLYEDSMHGRCRVMVGKEGDERGEEGREKGDTERETTRELRRSEMASQ